MEITLQVGYGPLNRLTINASRSAIGFDRFVRFASCFQLLRSMGPLHPYPFAQALLRAFFAHSFDGDEAVGQPALAAIYSGM